MLLQLSVEPMVGPPNRDLYVRIVCDNARGEFSDPQTSWLPRLLHRLCETSHVDADNITFATNFSHAYLAILDSWRMQIAASDIESDSIVEEFKDGPIPLVCTRLLNDRSSTRFVHEVDRIAIHRNSPEDQHKFWSRVSRRRLSITLHRNGAPSDDRHPKLFSFLRIGSRQYWFFLILHRRLIDKSFAELRRHVINLNAGRYSGDGEFSTSPADVRAMFREHIPRWASDNADDGPLRIVLYAHGGLTNEAWGLHTAAKQMKWWKKNGVYPIFFVWETGLWETLRQMFGDATRELGLGGTRGWFDGHHRGPRRRLGSTTRSDMGDNSARTWYR